MYSCNKSQKLNFENSSFELDTELEGDCLCVRGDITVKWGEEGRNVTLSRGNKVDSD